MKSFIGSIPEWLVFFVSFIAMLTGVSAAWAAFKTSVSDKFTLFDGKLKGTKIELLSKINNQQSEIDEIKSVIQPMGSDITDIKVMVGQLVALQENKITQGK